MEPLIHTNSRLSSIIRTLKAAVAARCFHLDWRIQLTHNAYTWHFTHGTLRTLLEYSNYLGLGDTMSTNSLSLLSLFFPSIADFLPTPIEDSLHSLFCALHSLSYYRLPSPSLSWTLNPFPIVDSIPSPFHGLSFLSLWWNSFLLPVTDAPCNGLYP